MFKCFTDAAKDAASQGAGIIADAAEKGKAAVKGKANEIALSQLKAALEGTREKEWDAPDVYITILEIDLKDGVEATDLNIFSLKGIATKARVEIIGTAAQLAGMVAADGTKKAAEGLSGVEKAIAEKTGLPSLGIGSFVTKWTEDTKTGLAAKAAEGTETKAADFDLLVDLEKTVGVAEVIAKAKILDTSSESIKKWMSNSIAQRYCEDAISRRVTNELTNLHKKYLNMDMAGAKIKEGAAYVIEKASEGAVMISEK